MFISVYKNIPFDKKIAFEERLRNILNNELKDNWKKSFNKNKKDLLKDSSIDDISEYIRKDYLRDELSQGIDDNFWCVTGFIDNLFYNRLKKSYVDTNKLFPTDEDNKKLNDAVYDEIKDHVELIKNFIEDWYEKKI